MTRFPGLLGVLIRRVHAIPLSCVCLSLFSPHVPPRLILLLGGTCLQVDQNWIGVFAFSGSKTNWRKQTPLLCGPGTITTVMLLSRDYGLLIPFIAITLSLLATWLVLYYSEFIQRILGEVVTDIMGKVLGMLLAAIAVKIIASGVIALAVIA
ncbi:MAG: MarC family protein [Methanomicrobiales archaeon]